MYSTTLLAFNIYFIIHVLYRADSLSRPRPVLHCKQQERNGNVEFSEIVVNNVMTIVFSLSQIYVQWIPLNWDAI